MEYHDPSPVVAGDILPSGRAGIETFWHLERLFQRRATYIAIQTVCASNVSTQVPAVGAARELRIGSIADPLNVTLIAPFQAEPGAALFSLVPDQTVPVGQP